MPNISDVVYWMTFAFLFGLVVALVWGIHVLGGLPGRIARRRGHPHAVAIGLCGWLALPTVVLWPLILKWAHTTPKAQSQQAINEQEVTAVEPDFHDVSLLLAEIKSRLAALPQLEDRYRR